MRRLLLSLSLGTLLVGCGGVEAEETALRDGLRERPAARPPTLPPGPTPPPAFPRASPDGMHRGR